MNNDAPHFARCLLAAQAQLRRRGAIDDHLCYVEAFEQCRLALKDLEGCRLDEIGAEQALDQIRRTIDTTSITGRDKRGAGLARALGLSRPEKIGFASAVDMLLLFVDSSAGRTWAAAHALRGI